MSNLVIKIKHNKDLTDLLNKAVEVANFAIKNRRKLSSKYVKHIGLPSAISNQILRKYGKNKKCKRIDSKKIKLVIPGQSVKILEDEKTKEKNIIKITPLKLSLINKSKYNITKVNQIELDNTYAYVCFEHLDKPLINTDNYIGVDLNATKHIAVVANPQTGKISKLGRQASHIHQKYKALRKDFQKKKLYRKLKQTKNKEKNKVKDLNHKIANKIVKLAKENKSGIKLEKLTGIRKNKKHKKSFRHSLHTWSFYQLNQMICYKARLSGIPVAYVDPKNTSKECSRCKQLGRRNGKIFKCVICKHTDHADVNAAFNIALRKMIGSDKTEIIRYGCTDKPMMQSISNNFNYLK